MATKQKKVLVIVESPVKARKIAGFLGTGYIVDATGGHIRDLAAKKSELPESVRSESWATLSVNVDKDFEPYYIVSSNKKAKVRELKALLKDVDEVLLATDEDREGEAIAWHVLEVLKPKVPYRRMVFHEVTQEAIDRAVRETRDISQALVDAQETRRIADRLWGYELSQVLWKRVNPGLSAGRVQSATLRLVIDREWERIHFVAADYWDVKTLFGPGPFPASLELVDGQKVAEGDSFDDRGALKTPDRVVLDAERATAIASGLRQASATVTNVERTPRTRKPDAPFITSTLQRAAGSRLGFSAKRTMDAAQSLYNEGYITYMRTDSPTLSEEAIAAARSQAAELYGADHVAASPRVYAGKSKNAQEAHEAIRPAGTVFRTPAEVSGELRGDGFALYELIWKRTVASQMADARLERTAITIHARLDSGEDLEFRATGQVVTFAGFLAALDDAETSSGDGTAKSPDSDRTRLPQVAIGDSLVVESAEAEGKSTRPPARYTEASLVKRMEELGIGRPSTYASTIDRLKQKYLMTRGNTLIPTWTGFPVVRLLEDHYPPLVDVEYTARFEETLDSVAAGTETPLQVLHAVYFGDEEEKATGYRGAATIKDHLDKIDPKANSTFVLPTTDAVVRVGKFGPYLERDGKTASIPEDLPPDELTPELIEELFSLPQEGRSLGTDPKSGHEVVVKNGRYGPYVTLVIPEVEPAEGATEVAQSQTEAAPSEAEGAAVAKAPAKKAPAKKKAPKPPTASLLEGMDPETISLEDALDLLALPRLVGIHPEDGEEVRARNGRFGPYLTHGKDNRSLPEGVSPLTVTLAQALELFSQPKRGRRVAANQGRVIGEEPGTGKEISVKDGRYGAYVTDGEYNATLKSFDKAEELSLDRALELLVQRREAGPAKKRTAKKTARKAPARKSTKK